MSPRPFERPATISLPSAEGLPAGASLDGLWLPARGEEEARGGRVAGIARVQHRRPPLLVHPIDRSASLQQQPCALEVTTAAGVH